MEVSPVPKCEGPGAPSAWLGKLTETGATRLETRVPGSVVSLRLLVIWETSLALV
jgi:hypothetical protein